MSTTIPAIRSVKARAIVAPIGRPVKTAFTTIDAAPLVLIDVETDSGVTASIWALASANKWLDIGIDAASAWPATRIQPLTPPTFIRSGIMKSLAPTAMA